MLLVGVINVKVAVFVCHREREQVEAWVVILISGVLKPLTFESSVRSLCQLNSITASPAPSYKKLFS